MVPFSSGDSAMRTFPIVSFCSVRQIDRYFINYNKNNNYCKLKQYRGRLPEGIHHQNWLPEHIHVIIITITNRLNTDKQNDTKDKKKEKGAKGIRTQAQLNVVLQTFDNILFN